MLETHQGTVRRIALELVERIRSLTCRINDLQRQITTIIGNLAPSLLALHGCGALTAAKILGETADVSRFSDRARFARFNGTAPIPVSSGN